MKTKFLILGLLVSALSLISCGPERKELPLDEAKTRLQAIYDANKKEDFYKLVNYEITGEFVSENALERAEGNFVGHLYADEIKYSRTTYSKILTKETGEIKPFEMFFSSWVEGNDFCKRYAIGPESINRTTCKSHEEAIERFITDISMFNDTFAVGLAVRNSDSLIDKIEHMDESLNDKMKASCYGDDDLLVEYDMVTPSYYDNSNARSKGICEFKNNLVVVSYDEYQEGKNLEFMQLNYRYK